MWIRSELKSRARQVLRGRYWISFAVALVAGLLTGRSSPVTYNFNFNDKSRLFNWDQFQNGGWANIEEFFRSNAFMAFMIIFITMFTIAFLAAIAYVVFVGSVVEAGRCRWFSRSRESVTVPRFSQMFSLFRRGNYMKTVGGMFWQKLFLALWGLLTTPLTIMLVLGMMGLFFWTGLHILNLFPADFRDIENMFRQGLQWFAPFAAASAIASVALYAIYIIKFYSYKIAPWILADNPAIGGRRALRLSIDLTRGHKWSMFVLDLSFIGWWLLSILTCGIGFVFLDPYYRAVQAEMYAVLRQDGISRGLCTMEEFGYIKAEQPVV